MRHIPLAGTLRGPGLNNSAPASADICSSASAPGAPSKDVPRAQGPCGRRSGWLASGRQSASGRQRSATTATKAVTLGLAMVTGTVMLPVSPAFAQGAPSGLMAYVTETLGVVTPVNIATGTAGTPITVGPMPTAIAITPDGKTAYVANEGSNTVTPITIATGTAGTPITVGSTPDAIAITPNGQTAYVANEGSRTVTPITVATGTAGTPIPVGNAPVAIAITPDGQTAYVVNTSSDSVTPITVATGTAGTPITVGLAPEGIAITPDGTTAYVVSNSASTDTPITIPITVASNTAGTPIPIGSYPDDMPWDIAINFGPVTTGSGSSGSTGSGPVVETANGSQANVTFGVTGGDRTATLAGAIAFPAVDASHSNVDATVQSASVQVNDLSASDAGWDVTLVASDLAGANGGTITAGNMSVTGYGALASISGATTNIQTGTPGSIGSPTALLSASPGSGVGDYTQAFNLGLVLPADSLAGSYAGTLTVTIAPPL